MKHLQPTRWELIGLRVQRFSAPEVLLLLLALLLFVGPVVIIAKGIFTSNAYRDAVESALSAAWGTLISSLIVGLLIFRFQRRIERTKFIQEVAREVNRIMASQTAWIVREPNSSQQQEKSSSLLHAVDFRYAVGKLKWPSDPKALVCDQSEVHSIKPFHLAAHFPLERKHAKGIKFPGLLYDMGIVEDRSGPRKLDSGAGYDKPEESRSQCPRNAVRSVRNLKPRWA
ncbi:MAG: hypothetical protein SFV32_10115 [Opitutaceae bacterium]|nr:hypothetical protein [Opitutaceae bacterium]